jgi:hypothetical protein
MDCYLESKEIERGIAKYKLVSEKFKLPRRKKTSDLPGVSDQDSEATNFHFALSIFPFSIQFSNKLVGQSASTTRSRKL